MQGTVVSPPAIPSEGGVALTLPAALQGALGFPEVPFSAELVSAPLR